MSKPAVGWSEGTGKDGPAPQALYAKLSDWELTDAGSGCGLVAYLREVGPRGGTNVVAPTVIPGYEPVFAFFADPEGHVVGLSKGAIQ